MFFEDLTTRSTHVSNIACLIFAFVFGLFTQGAAAQLRPRPNTKTVCDWAFVDGPNKGLSGKESRRFALPFPQLHGTTYWAGGANDSALYILRDPSSLSNPPGTRWQVTVPKPNGNISATLAVRESRHVHATTQRLTFFPVSNGAYVDCLELNAEALDRIRRHFGPGDRCDCAHRFNYASTVACLEGCAAHWDDDSKWNTGPAPSCLADRSIVVQAACLLDHRWIARPGDPDDGDPQNPGGGIGAFCNDLQPCRPGLLCDRSRCTKPVS